MRTCCVKRHRPSQSATVISPLNGSSSHSLTRLGHGGQFARPILLNCAPGYCCHEMDPLSVTSNVAQILTLLFSIAQGSHGVLQSWKGFRKDLVGFTAEIESILRWLDSFQPKPSRSVVSDGQEVEVCSYLSKY